MERLYQRIPTQHETYNALYAGFPYGRNQAFELLHGDCNGFLDDKVLVRLRCQCALLGVGKVGRAYGDNVNVGVSKHLFIVGIGLGIQFELVDGSLGTA